MDIPEGAAIFRSYPKNDTVIVKGSKVSWSFEFCEATAYLELEGVGYASMKDIRAGEWQITTQPTKTTKYRVISKRSGLKSTVWDRNITVYVVDTEAEAEKMLANLRREKEEAKLALRIKDAKETLQNKEKALEILDEIKDPEERKRWAEGFERSFREAEKFLDSIAKVKQK